MYEKILKLIIIEAFSYSKIYKTVNFFKINLKLN